MKMHEIRVMVTEDQRKIISTLSKKYGLKQYELCGLWMGIINPNDQRLIDAIMQKKAIVEVKRLSKTRNALLERLKQKRMLEIMDEMSTEQLEKLAQKLTSKYK